MSYYEFEDISASPEEANMQKSKQSILDIKQQQKEEEIKESEIKEQKEDIKEAKSYQSLFYPIIQSIQDYILKDADIPPASNEDKESLKIATAELELKYAVNKINSEEARFITAFITPIAKNFNKFYEYLKDKVNGFRTKPIKEPVQEQKGNFNGSN